jgi:uncharacterized RDD family membrane protein YckC
VSARASRATFAHQGHYAGPVSRLLAYGADLFAINVVYVGALALLQFAINTATPWTVELQSGYWWVIAGDLLWAAIYFGVSWVIFARSPGMSLLGLRIVRSSGSDLDRRRALIRLVAFPLGFLTLGLGFLGIIFGRRHQAIYDRIADTAVVYDWDAEAARIRSLAKRGERRREAQPEAAAER